jgi:hypothetical protein
MPLLKKLNDLYQKLQQARSEEDVKDAYIKALGVKDYPKIFTTYKQKKYGLKRKMDTNTAPIKCLRNTFIMCSRR